MYNTEVPPALVPGGNIHQKSVIHYSVVAVSVLYLAPAIGVFCAVVVPSVAEYLNAHKCHITGQKDSCAHSESIPMHRHNVAILQFSSSIVSPDLCCNSYSSCELNGWIPQSLPIPALSPFLPCPTLTWQKCSSYESQKNHQYLHCQNYLSVIHCCSCGMWPVGRWEVLQSYRPLIRLQGHCLCGKGLFSFISKLLKRKYLLLV